MNPMRKRLTARSNQYHQCPGSQHGCKHPPQSRAIHCQYQIKFDSLIPPDKQRHRHFNPDLQIKISSSPSLRERILIRRERRIETKAFGSPRGLGPGGLLRNIRPAPRGVPVHIGFWISPWSPGKDFSRRARIRLIF